MLWLEGTADIRLTARETRRPAGKEKFRRDEGVR